MSIWGAKLYQNDVSDDVRHEYKELLRQGIDDKQATQELINNFTNEINDSVDAPLFWIALADMQWELGRLEEIVKEKALYYIETDIALQSFEQCSEKLFEERKIVLSELRHKLLSPQPSKKKIPIPRLYSCTWQIGDVFAYRLESEYAKENGLYGRYFLFQKVDETLHYPGHIVPVVRVKLTDTDNLPDSTASFDRIAYVPINVIKRKNISMVLMEKADEHTSLDLICDEFGLLHEYRIKLCNTSKQSIPKKLIFIGNFNNALPPPNEFVSCNKRDLDSTPWKFLEEHLINVYLRKKH